MSERDLKPDCANCFGLCCVAPPFSASADFPSDKPAGKPCHHLQADFRCEIHARLRQEGFRGCSVYDCFGAGQKVAQVTYAGRDWRQAPETAKEMFDVYVVMRQLHELLRYLTEALRLPPASDLHDEISALLNETERLTLEPPETLLRLEVIGHRGRVNALLSRVSERVRAGAPGRKRQRRRRDLIGANLKGTDLRGADLRGAYLIGADLEGADLRLADVIGADFRDADLRGADVSTSIFLTQSQLTAARGDATTKIPPGLIRPPHWSFSRRSGARRARRVSTPT